MRDSKTYQSVNAYFDAQPEATRKALSILKACILEAVPDAAELINYNIPAYALVKNGKREQQVMIAGYKKHVGFYPHPTTMEKFDRALSGYTKGKGSVQFPLDKPLPKDLIVRMVRYRRALLITGEGEVR
ncbi:Uncharacterized conserved protein YdhG, YjbR/CyaY-like superfamily, DUF1801 family [Sinomicrobium oceani]|uniref:Uncharacterized conserved protein YdhG, YjbR/CyaY-like superfamily, DUF1801 family n=1 Tax=Sinomicrobium oceani TaxID=1150368 RepID=A0A1K1RZ84_9FLAO|nr:DUF1801 domain-containing protein [Sinomicrobium oceani]SFW77266.1 Uncharacterized conserved protein YdhG, YjbR/CyaY-like superfamily, DUF1801 family [Sinomicrobium oceani]